MSVGTAAARLARWRSTPDPAPRCDLCAVPLDGTHRHLLDTDDHDLRCVCTPCRILFEQPGAGNDRLRVVPRRWQRADAGGSDAAWAATGIPVGLALLTLDDDGSPSVRYPGPAGPVDGVVALDAWHRLRREVPLLSEISPHVETVLVDRRPGHHDVVLVPTDEAYAFVARVRDAWTGLGGGPGVDAVVDEMVARAPGRGGADGG